MNQDILEKVWKLRTDPFSPRLDAAGHAINENAVSRTLDPFIDERAVHFYFDVYDWTSSHLVRDLSAEDGFRTFPNARLLPRNAAVMVILSGPGESGLDSLANLVIHKFRQTIGHTPLVVDGVLQNRDKVRNVAYIARRIYVKLRTDEKLPAKAKEIANAMNEEFDRVDKEEKGRRDATYAEVFEAYQDLLAPLDRKLVIKITGSGDNDSWVRIYNSAKSCCSFVVVMTSDRLYAKTCYDAMIALNQNVAWIRAVPLDRAKAEAYLQQRLTVGRLPNASFLPAQGLIPFTSSAIDALYEPGASVKPTSDLGYPVGWLRRTFDQAFVDRLDELARAHADLTPEALASVDPASALIGSVEIRAAREKLNLGR